MNSPQEKPKGTCSLVTLGCPKNLVDSERMLGLLDADGYQLVDRPEGADFVVINTCGFIEIARQESLEAIREMIRLKERGQVGRVIVAGCLAERDRESLLETCPGIDRLVGVFARDEIVRAVEVPPDGPETQRAIIHPVPDHALLDNDRLRITLKHVAYLKIAEGCDRRCSFCTIPSIRGRHLSKSIDQVVVEAEQLVAGGVRELVLVSQDTSYYGVDTSGHPQLAQLLVRLEQIDGLDWIRLMYLYPMHLTNELIGVIASPGKTLPYVDMPLQHISDDILKRMNRRPGRAEIEKLIQRLRRQIEGVVIRTTMITGFPGETDEQFDELLRFVRRSRFERLGAFAYCREPNTPAARLDGQLPDSLKQKRRDRLMEVQQEVAFDWNCSQVGKRLEVLIDRCIPGEKNAYVGRSCADAPDVDGAVYVTGENLLPGQIVPCEIVSFQGYDLVGVVVE